MLRRENEKIIFTPGLLSAGYLSPFTALPRAGGGIKGIMPQKQLDNTFLFFTFSIKICKHTKADEFAVNVLYIQSLGKFPELRSY